MSTSLRLLFLADAPAASRAVGLIEQQTPVEASLATDIGVFYTALRDERWDGVLVIPGCPIPDHDIARTYSEAGHKPPLLVVASTAPDLLRRAGANAVAPGALGALGALLRTVALGRFSGVPKASPVASSPARPSPQASAPPAEAATRAPLVAEPASVPIVRPERAPSSMPSSEDEQVRAGDVSESEENVAGLADHLPIGMYRSTPEGRILYANPALVHILGMPDVEHAAHLDVRWDLAYPRDEFESRIRETGEVRNLIVQWTHPSGRTVHTRENARIVRNGRGRVLYYEGTMEDVTEEIAAAERERHQTRYFETAARFFDAADDAQTTADLHQNAVRAFRDAFGADAAVLVRPFKGRNRIVARHGISEDVEASIEANEQFATSSLPDRTTVFRTVESSAVLLDSMRDALAEAGLSSFGCFPLIHEGHSIGAILVGFKMSHSFSEEEVRGGEMLAWHLAGHLARRAAERALEDTETTLKFVVEQTEYVMYRRRYSGAYDYLSPVIERLTGYTADALIGMGGLDALVTERLVQEGDGLLQGPLEDGEERYLALCRIQTRDGNSKWVEHRASAWTGASGHPVGIVGVLHDVTDRKRREDGLADEAQRALRRQESLVELSAVRTGHEIPDLVMQRAVEEACRATGTRRASVWLRAGDRIACRAQHPAGGGPVSYSVDAFEAVVQGMAGQRALAIADVETDERAAALGLRAFASSMGATGLLLAPIWTSGDVAGGLILHRKEGEPQSGELWREADIAFAAAVADALALSLEREERAEAQRALALSEARYRTLAELTSDYAFAVHADDEGHGSIAWATDAFERISGYTPEAIGTTHGLADILHPQSLPTACAAFARLAEVGEVEFETRIMTRNEETRWVHHRARVSDDGSGVVYHSGEDITERKQFEVELVEARERAEAMGRLKSAFLANMSHEIRTPLTSILGYSDLLLDELEADQRDFVLHIARSGVRLLDTLNSVLDLARLEADGVELQVRPLTVADHVEAAIEPYREEAERAGLGFHVDTDPRIQAELDPACFQRIVSNLVGNAVKFTEAGGVAVQVEADATHVHLHVRDTGVGMDDTFLDNLFADFQQESFGHNRSYEGTGLGLSITKRYVDLLGGTIDVETRKGVGTSFRVSFPLTATQRQPSVDVAEPRPVHGEPFEVEELDLRVGDMVVGEAIGAVSEGLSSARSEAYAEPRSVSIRSSGSAIMPDERNDGGTSPTSGVGFERSPASADTSSAPPAFVSPFQGSSPNPDPTVSHDPPLPTDMFFNRPASQSDAADVHGDAPVSEPEASASAPGLADQPMIVRGPAGDPPPAPASWPTAPSAPAAAAAPAPAADTQSASVPGSTTPTQATTPSDDDRPSILVVEDNDDTRMLLDRILRSSYTVTAVGDARSALIEMNRNQFVGLVLDINLGGKETGADILRIARTLEGYTDVFAIALTAYALPGDRERLLEAGFNEYISKPFTRHSLMEALSLGLAH